MKNVLITGATGMVGSLVLDHCLSSPEIEAVNVFGRRPSGKTHPKLTDTLVADFSDFSGHTASFKDIDTAYFCLGVYTGQVSDAEFKTITIDYAVEFAKALKLYSPQAVLCLLSGAGADRSGKSNMSFAKYKGIAEQEMSEMGLGAFYTFRPGYIYPVERRTEPNIAYSIMRGMYPVLRLFGKNASIKSTELAAAMFNVGLNGAKKEILENRDILDYLPLEIHAA